MPETAQSCVCKVIVTRAYRELVAEGYRDEDAFRSAVNVYRCRHPAAPSKNAPYIVAEWICEEIGQ